MGIDTKILQLFNKPIASYKGMRVNIFGLPVFNQYKKKTLENSFSRLKQKGFLHKENNKFALTLEGKSYLFKQSKNLKVFKSVYSKDIPKNLIVMYDIPEPKKKEREWFRFHLKKFGYIMIQKSVWVGPSPLPKDFLDYLKEIKIGEHFKTFKLAKPYKEKGWDM